MTKEIYNEGRVVGMSSYEEYVRQLKSVDANFDVCSEREWLSSSLAMGSSLILKIPQGAGTQVSGTDMYMYQIEAPESCRLAAGNNIVASFFYGTCTCDAKGWATAVQDYGSLISNKGVSNPQDNATTVDTSTVPVGYIKDELNIDKNKNVNKVQFTETQKCLYQYVKIADGIVIQPGTWKETGKSNPYKNFFPNLTKKPVLRFTFMEKITHDFYILLTGFTNTSVLRGITKFDLGAVDTDNPQNGDFLGPECYPWAAKIQFVSSPASDYLMKSSLRSGSRNVKIETYNDKPIIKVTSNNLLDTKVYSRQSDTTTDKSGKDNFGTATTKWKGTNDASHWYDNNSRSQNVISCCTDNNIDTSGSETVTTNTIKNPYANDVNIGLNVTNKYQDDDRNTIGNGDHGGWYDIEIDPYQLIKDFIDECFARFKYIDTRLDEIEAEIKNEITHRKDGDKYLLSRIYSGDGGVDTIVSLLNELLKTIYNPKGTLGLTVTYQDVKIDNNYDSTDVGTLRKPTFSWSKDKDGNVVKPDVNDGTIPRGKLNIYSGDTVGANATNFIRSRADNSENDIHQK